MSDERFRLALEHFERALARLHEALAQPENEFIRDATIQRFEGTFEAAWKAMYRWRRARGVDVDEDAYSTIPEAFRRRLITEEKHWGEMRRYRNPASHTCNQPPAIEVLASVRAEGVAALDALAQRLRERTP